MVQPQPSSEAGSHGSRLSNFIVGHIARGNKPDYELAQRILGELKYLVAGLEPLGFGEQQVERLASEHGRPGSS